MLLNIHKRLDEIKGISGALQIFPDDGDDENKVQNNAVRRARNLLNSALLSDDEQLA